MPSWIKAAARVIWSTIKTISLVLAGMAIIGAFAWYNHTNHTNDKLANHTWSEKQHAYAKKLATSHKIRYTSGPVDSLADGAAGWVSLAALHEVSTPAGQLKPKAKATGVIQASADLAETGPVMQAEPKRATLALIERHGDRYKATIVTHPCLPADQLQWDSTPFTDPLVKVIKLEVQLESANFCPKPPA